MGLGDLHMMGTMTFRTSSFVRGEMREDSVACIQTTKPRGPLSTYSTSLNAAAYLFPILHYFIPEVRGSSYPLSRRQIVVFHDLQHCQ